MAEQGDPLEGIAVLEGMAPEKRAELARECRWQTFSKGQSIFDKENDSRDVMFIVSGTVNVIGFSLAGKEISFTEIQAGDFLGEVAAIDGEPRSASVSAVTDCKLASLNPTRFAQLLEQEPVIAARVMRRLTTIIRRATERLMDFTTLNVQQRVCAELLRLAQPDPAVAGAWSIHPLPTQVTLSSRVGASRETVARIMSDLAKGDLIVRKGRTVTIPDRERLETVAARLSDDN